MDIHVLRDAQKPFMNLDLKRGAGAFEINAQKVLDALWASSLFAGTEGVVERIVFDPFMLKLGKYFRALNEKGCFSEDTVYDYDRINQFEEIHMTRREFLQKSQNGRSENNKKENVKILAAGPNLGISEEKAVENNPLKIPQVEKESDAIPAYIFIDLPNLATSSPDKVGSYIRLSYINWMAFRGLLTFDPKCSKSIFIKKAFVYVRAPFHIRDEDEANQWYIDAQIKMAGFNPIYAFGGRDIDSLMVTDIMGKVMPAIKENGEIALIIVSGDWGYTSSIKSIKEEAARKNCGCLVKIFSWKEKLSSELSQVVDSMEDIVYIDELQPVLTLSKWAREKFDTTNVAKMFKNSLQDGKVLRDFNRE